MGARRLRGGTAVCRQRRSSPQCPRRSGVECATLIRPLRILAKLAFPLVVAAPLAASLLAPRVALAQAPKVEKLPQSVSVPAGAGQDALWLQYGAKGVVARACAAACGPAADAPALAEVPAEVLPGLVTAQHSVITLADGKRVVRIDAEVVATVDGAKADEAKVVDDGKAVWTMFLAAPLAGKSAGPVVLWSGYVGKKKGLEGEEAVNVVRVEPLTKGARIVIGEQHANLTICGRPAVVSAREIDPATLTLAKGAMIDSLSADEKKKAEKVVAVRETGASTAPVVRLLRATSASSALEKRIGSLTDGSAETGWTEAKIGDGHGEWVRMSASSDVGITGLSLQIRPGTEVPDGAAPKTLYFASDDRLFEVQIPDSAWGDKDARYEVKLPEAVRTSCLSVVLGDAHTPKGVTNPRVSIAEISAHTALDAMTFEGLAGELAGGGDKARAAAALLGKGDSKAMKAVAGTWEKLDSTGKKLAMDVIDGAACIDQAPFYADLLATAKGKKMAGPTADPIVVHARDRLRRCGRASAPPLAKLLREAPDPIKIVAAEELALVAPSEAIEPILEAIGKAPDPVRRDLRGALSRAATSPKAHDALVDWMTPAKLGSLGEVAKVDLLRAAGPALPGIDGGKKALFELAGKDSPFRTRFLLLAPAAELAGKGDAEAEAFVRDALVKDLDPHVRARAAEVAAKVPTLGPQLVTAVDDGEVRVREAALRALTQSAGQGQKLPASAELVLVTRLTTDAWTFVRTGAAEALSAMPKGDSVDKALAGALSDVSAEVRGRALDGLGGHKARAFAGKVRERVEATDENLDVRARAVLALGAMCDKDSVVLLTKLALRTKSPTSEADRRLGAAAISALGDLQPDDLGTRVSPLMAKDAPPLVREMAKAAMSAKPTCKKK